MSGLITFYKRVFSKNSFVMLVHNWYLSRRTKYWPKMSLSNLESLLSTNALINLRERERVCESDFF